MGFKCILWNYCCIKVVDKDINSPNGPYHRHYAEDWTHLRRYNRKKEKKASQTDVLHVPVLHTLALPVTMTDWACVRLTMCLQSPFSFPDWHTVDGQTDSNRQIKIPPQHHWEGRGSFVMGAGRFESLPHRQHPCDVKIRGPGPERIILMDWSSVSQPGAQILGRVYILESFKLLSTEISLKTDLL